MSHLKCLSLFCSFHTPHSCVLNWYISAVTFQKDLVPLRIFKWVPLLSSELNCLGWSRVKYSPLFRGLRNIFKNLGSAVEMKHLEIWLQGAMGIYFPAVCGISAHEWTCTRHVEFTLISACQLLSAWYGLNLTRSWRGHCTWSLQLYKGCHKTEGTCWRKQSPAVHKYLRISWTLLSK